jgi:hypothetical protein
VFNKIERDSFEDEIHSSNKVDRVVCGTIKFERDMSKRLNMFYSLLWSWHHFESCVILVLLLVLLCIDTSTCNHPSFLDMPGKMRMVVCRATEYEFIVYFCQFKWVSLYCV